MRENTATIVKREDYAPPPFWIRSVELSFDLDPTKTIVASKMRVQRNALTAAGQALVLHGEDITVLRVSADGQSVSFRQEGAQLIIDQPPSADEFTLELRNTCSPEKNTELSGLYTSSGGLFTQCEAEGFRRITYFLDRPDVMAVYTVTLRADKARFPVLLSNGNLLEQGDLEGGRHYAKWHDPFPKPSYLFALVAGNLVAREQRIRTRSGKDHLLQIYVRPGDLEKTEHAMNSLVASVVWDEARFGLALDLERYMIVAVQDYNSGAMENKGLNIFNTSCVLASPATANDRDFFGIESVIAHEYFHNWTGNRITCRDWFQLSLKEGLTVFRDQEFSMDMAHTASARAVKRIDDVVGLRAAQFPEDAGPMAHPVRPDQYAAIDNFYTATVYEKGAEVVRMMQTLVGRAGFERGMTLYFQRHDGQAVTCDDFAQAIADANPGSALSTRLEAFKRWYAQSGTPRVSARGDYDEALARYTLHLTQSCPPTPGQTEKAPFVIPLLTALIGADGGELMAPQLLVLEEATQTFVFEGITAKPVHSVARGFSAPIVLDDGLSDAEHLVLLTHDSDPFNRWEAAQKLATRRIVDAVNAPGTQTLDDGFIEAMRRVLRHPDLDPAFKNEVLQLPGERFIAEQLQQDIDPQRIHLVRERFRYQQASALEADWQWAYEQHQVRDGYAATPAQAGQRALANRALAMLCLRAAQTGDSVWPGRAYQRFKDAGNMSDRQGALNALVNSHAALAGPALERMLEIFKDDALVVDKWFAMQAGAVEPLGERTGTVFARALGLLKHPAFSLKNPNRARSVLSTLFSGNPAAFHSSDGAGYARWADMVLDLDARNARVAARMARAMDRWRILAEPYRSLSRAAIERVAAKAELSADVREVVTHALAGGQ